MCIRDRGLNEYIRVADSAKIIAGSMGLQPEYRYGEGKRGWVGDNPFVFLDTTKIQELGWKPSYGIRESVEETSRWLNQNDWIFEERS